MHITRLSVRVAFSRDSQRCSMANSVLSLLTLAHIPYLTLGCPLPYPSTTDSPVMGPHGLSKAVYKSGEIADMPPIVTLATIKSKLKETGVFDWQDPTLTDRERKEMNKVFEAIEIMMTSRARQPSSVQSVFTSLRMVERVVNKQHKEGQVSDSLAARFKWDNLRTRVRRQDASSTGAYHLDKDKRMRNFHIEP